jgi:hypothetical protein
MEDVLSSIMEGYAAQRQALLASEAALSSPAADGLLPSGCLPSCTFDLGSGDYEEIGGALGLSASLESLTRIVSPIVGGFLPGNLGTAAPGIVGALLMGLLIPFVWKRVLFVPGLVCPEPVAAG